MWLVVIPSIVWSWKLNEFGLTTWTSTVRLTPFSISPALFFNSSSLWLWFWLGIDFCTWPSTFKNEMKKWKTGKLRKIMKIHVKLTRIEYRQFCTLTFAPGDLDRSNIDVKFATATDVSSCVCGTSLFASSIWPNVFSILKNSSSRCFFWRFSNVIIIKWTDKV